MTGERTACLNALIALLQIVDLGIDARKPSTGQQIAEASRWRTRAEDLATATARAEATRLAKRIVALEEELAANHKGMEALVRATPAAGLPDKAGIGPVTAAIAITAWSHPGRVRSEAAFACLAGVNPIPALREHHAAPAQPRRRPATEPSTAHGGRHPHAHGPRYSRLRRKRRAEGRTTTEIRRCIKRCLARHIYRHLTAAHAQAPAT